jgi:hypothetical protein
VKFQLDDLCRAETDSSIRKVLRNLPRDLVETYGRLLARIDNSEQQKYIKRMFTWIVCAKRPLEVDELREAIAFTLEDDHFDAAKIPNDLKRLARACGNLIVIDDEDDKVQIAHYTVEQYLVTKQEFRPSAFCFTREQANFEAGKVCLAYLSFSDFESQLTQYGNNTNSNFAVLKDVVSTQSMLPPNSQAAKLVKTLKHFRGNRSISTTINIEPYVHGQHGKNSAFPLSIKYRLLSYVAETWLHHTSMIGEASKGTEWSPRHVRLFEIVAFERTFSFNVRPWDFAPFEQHDHRFVLQIGWAISKNHLYLLHTLATNRSYNARACFGQATHDFSKFLRAYVEEDSPLRRFSQRSSETWPQPLSWEPWIYRCILEASDQGLTNILHFCFLNFIKWKSGKGEKGSDLIRDHSRVVGYLILDAAASSHTSVIETLNTIIKTTWPEALQRELWTITIPPIYAARALETAFLSESEHLVELLALAGCKVSGSFKESLARGPYLREALDSNSVVKIKLFLTILGATTSSLSNIESRLRPSDISFSSHVDEMLTYVVSSTVGSDKIESPDPYHWIWAIGGDNYQDHIDVLLAAGGTPLPVHTSWLLCEAITKNRYGRLQTLLKNPYLQNQRRSCRLTREQVQAMRQMHPTSSVLCDEGFEFISPLSCAVFYERLEMMESLLEAGAPVNDSDSSFGLAPIHFAAITDSLMSFRCLERHGANLEMRDDKGRDIEDLLLSRHPERTSQDSLFDFLKTRRLVHLYTRGHSSSRYPSKDWGVNTF